MLTILRAAAATTSTTVAGTQSICGLHYKAHITGIYLDAAGLFIQPLVHTELEALNLQHFIQIARLIQSHGQSWAASATGCQVYAHSSLFLSGKESFKLLYGAIAYVKHNGTSTSIYKIYVIIGHLIVNINSKPFNA